jgi:Ca-activated chloride channel family protein
MIVAVGVGTREGTLLPDTDARRRGGFLRDDAGRPVRSKLEDHVLEGLARETGGLYLNLSSSSLLKERIQVILGKLDRSRSKAQKEKRQAIERYRWALVPGLLCLVAAFIIQIGRRLRSFPTLSLARRPAVAGAAAALALACPGVVHSADAQTATNNPWKLYRAQKYEDAIDVFGERIDKKPSADRLAELEFGRGASAFRLKDYDAAIESFGRALISPDRSLRAKAQYNLANALAESTQAVPKGKGRLSRMIRLLDNAIEHYDGALEQIPANADAKHNRDAAEKYRDELKKYKEQLRQKKKNGGKQGKEEQQEGQQGQQGEQNENGQDGQQGQTGKSGKQGEDDAEDAEDEGEGEGEAENPEGEGEKGQKPGEGQEQNDGGKKGRGQDDQKQPGPEGNEKERSGEQKSDGKLEAKGGGQGADGSQRKQPNEHALNDADARRDKATGFSRTEARALLRALADEDFVRPLTDKPVREGTFKNW